MSQSISTGPELADRIIDEIDRIVKRADDSDKPLEVDPARARLFELFVTAHGSGYLEEGAERDLSADGLCHVLAEQWGLRAAALESTASQSRIPPDQLAKMRRLWSVMRMWMEWTYAWSRWDEFHRDVTA
ncbi:MAG: hypothetical protein AB7U20_01740 [Planctomycetaceae bacterium]